MSIIADDYKTAVAIAETYQARALKAEEELIKTKAERDLLQKNHPFGTMYHALKQAQAECNQLKAKISELEAEIVELEMK